MTVLVLESGSEPTVVPAYAEPGWTNLSHVRLRCWHGPSRVTTISIRAFAPSRGTFTILAGPVGCSRQNQAGWWTRN